MQVSSVTQPRVTEETQIRVSKALFLSAAGISLLMSIYLWFSGDREAGLYVGLWVPSICSAGSIILYRGRAHE
jgi:hypothetical protein